MKVYVNGADVWAVDKLRLWLIEKGDIALCPLDVQAVGGISHADYMRLCYGLIELSDRVLVPKGWDKTEIGNAEVAYAKSLGKKIQFESKQWGLRNGK